MSEWQSIPIRSHHLMMFIHLFMRKSSPIGWILISLSVLDSLDGKGGYLIKDVSITNSQPYVTDILDLNATYILELTEGSQSAQPSWVSFQLQLSSFTHGLLFSMPAWQSFPIHSGIGFLACSVACTRVQRGTLRCYVRNLACNRV